MTDAGVDEVSEEDRRRTTVELPSGLGAQSSTISSAEVDASFAMGRLEHDGSKVLVPFMTCGLTGAFPDDPEERTVRATVTFDNAAFLMKRLAEEYLEAVETFDAMTRGGLTLPAARVDLAIRWLQDGATSLSAAARELAELRQRRESGAEQPDGDEPAGDPDGASSRKPRTRRTRG